MPTRIGFTLNGIQEVAYWFREPKVELKDSEADLGFSIENSISANQATNTIDIKSHFEIRRIQSTEEKKKAPYLRYEVIFQFEVEGIDFVPQPDEEPGYEYIQLPKGLVPALVGTVYSTCRGILFSRTLGSQLHNYLLPIANPVEMVTEADDKLRKKVSVSNSESST